MPHCSICGEHDGLNNKCNYCGRKHCKTHTLPENHRCVGLRSEGWEKYKQAREAREDESRKSDTPSGEDTSWGRDWSTTPAKEKKRSHSGWWKKGQQDPDPEKDKPESEGDTGKHETQQEVESIDTGQESTETTGDDSPPVETKAKDSLPPSPSRLTPNGRQSVRKSVTDSRPYVALHAFGEFITTAVSFIVGVPLRVFRFVFSLRGFLFLLVVAGGVGGYSALEGTGIPAVDDTVDGIIESTNSITAGMSDDSTAHLGGKFGDVRLEGKQIIVEVEETNFNRVEVVTPDGSSDGSIIGVSGEYTFTSQQELPTGTYTVRAIARTGLADQTVVDSHSVELSQ